ncbi:MAG TPA: hypothetical protein DDW78_00100 [Treponema sp.]|nr:hypothetical protein [Treponema sp.]
MHRYTSTRETIFSYDYLAHCLKLEKADRDIDKRLLNDSLQDIAAFLGEPLESFGYTRENLSDELKEAIVIVFTNKHSMYKKAADYTSGDDMDDVLERKFDSGELDFDEFFDKFATIPAEAQAILLRLPQEEALPA